MFRTLLEPLAIDFRSLAAFRIGLGVLLLIDLAIRAPDLTAHYTDAGIAPREVVADFYVENGYRWSLHSLSGEWPWQAALFGATATAAIFLMVGRFTRAATIAAWVLVFSLQSRNPLLSNGGDTLTALLLFWGMFLPLGRAWSLDARRRRENASLDAPLLNVATAAVLLQMCFVYWFAAYYKQNELWDSGWGLYNALSFDAFARPLGKSLLAHPELLMGLGTAAVWVEWIAPTLVLVPVLFRWLRPIALLAVLGLHVGIELTMSVGLFSYVCLVGWLLFVPGFVWNRLGGRHSPARAAGGSGERQEAAAGGGRGALGGVGWLAVQVLCGVFLAYMIAVNLARTPIGEKIVPQAAWEAGRVLGLNQKWGMFADTRVNGWCAIAARLKDGRSVDLLRGGQPYDPAKPESMRKVYRTERWRKFFTRAVRERYAMFRKPLCDFYVRQWNAAHGPDEQVEMVAFYDMREQIEPPGKRAYATETLIYRDEFGERPGAFRQRLQVADPLADSLPPGI